MHAQSYWPSLQPNSLHSDHQYGFCKARSTGDILSYLAHSLSGHPLSGASENSLLSHLTSLRHLTVWHKALLAKLSAYGFTSAICKLISSFLSNLFIYVVVDDTVCASFPISSGIPRGSVLSPTLFLLLITDLHASVSDVHSFVYYSILHKSSYHSQPSSSVHSQSHLAMSLTIN